MDKFPIPKAKYSQSSSSPPPSTSSVQNPSNAPPSRQLNTSAATIPASNLNLNATANAFTLTSSPSIRLNALPSGSYLVHATNCLGIWGAGIAGELKPMYPQAFGEYKRFCDEAIEEQKKWPGRERCGRCLVCAPEVPTKENSTDSDKTVEKGKGELVEMDGVRVVCLCTSLGFGKGIAMNNPSATAHSATRGARGGRGGRGRGGWNYTTNFNNAGRPGKDSPDLILEQTESALREFREILEHRDVEGGEVVIYSPRFNAGMFKVPWEHTETKIRDVFRGFKGRWVVLNPPE